MTSKKECNLNRIVAASFFNALKYDGAVYLAFKPFNYGIVVPILAGTAGLTTRGIANQCLTTQYFDDYYISILGGVAGGAIKYALKGSNAFIGSFNNAAYELLVNLHNLDSSFSTYFIETTDQIMGDSLGKEFSLIKSSLTGIYVGFILNGMANEKWFSFEYIIDKAYPYLPVVQEDDSTFPEQFTNSTDMCFA
jgi:hypothetical protein